MVTIVLDPGHGGPSNPPKLGGSSWNNATGPTGLLEKTITLQVGEAARTALAGLPLTVVLTRTGDTNLGIQDRAGVARTRQAEVFVSIHFNAPEANKPAAQGTETWINPNPTAPSRALAGHVQTAVVAATGHRNRGIKNDIVVSGVLRNDFHSPKTAHCLVEISFLTRQPAEEARLRTPDYITRLGVAVKDGIVAYCLAAGLMAAPAGPAMMAAAEPEDAASARAMGLILDDADDAAQRDDRAAAVFAEAASPDLRMRMATLIVNDEARRTAGKVIVYEPPGNDGGGRFEVAGINVRYHPDAAWALRGLVEAGKPDEAEAFARDYIAQYTDQVASWCTFAAVEYCLRDTAFNRGKGGAAEGSFVDGGAEF